MTIDNDYHAYSLDTLKTQCEQETAQLKKSLAAASNSVPASSPTNNNTGSCFEIWRRAISDQNQAAWLLVYTIYTDQVRFWICRYFNNWAHQAAEGDFLVNGVFIRFHNGVPAHKFNNFAGLAQLLAYLKRCAMSEALNELRRYKAHQPDILLGQLEAEAGARETEGGTASKADLPDTSPPLEDKADWLADRHQFWQLIRGHCHDKPDELVIYARLVLKYKPAEIRQMFPRHFAGGTEEIYERLENVLRRLRKDPQLRQWWQDLQN